MCIDLDGIDLDGGSRPMCSNDGGFRAQMDGSMPSNWLYSAELQDICIKNDEFCIKLIKTAGHCRGLPDDGPWL